MAHYFKELTPKFRDDINDRIAQGRVEVRVSDLHPLTKAVLDSAFITARDLINSLPDNTLIPMKGYRNE